jgi:tripartite-type tricarboxylate transporter receptor subunit TctC
MDLNLKEDDMKLSSVLLSVFLAVWILNIGIVQNLQAQPYPSHPINLIVTMDPGAGADTAGRHLAEELGKILKTQVIVVNKPGAGSTLGADFVVKSRKDGYTLLYATASSVVYTKATNPEVVAFDPVKDLEPLGLHCFFPVTVTVQQTSPWKTFGELIDHARKNPAAVRVSVPGQGNIDHLNVEIVMSLTGTQFTVVPFKGAGAAMTALLGGHVDAAAISIPLAAPHVKAGKLRNLLLSNKLREFQDAPTLTELGYPQDLLYPWFALYAPSGVPDEVRKVLVPAIEKAVKNAEMAAKLEKLGFMVEYRSPAELRKLQESDYARARPLVLKLGLGK